MKYIVQIKRLEIFFACIIVYTMVDLIFFVPIQWFRNILTAIIVSIIIDVTGMNKNE